MSYCEALNVFQGPLHQALWWSHNACLDSQDCLHDKYLSFTTLAAYHPYVRGAARCSSCI